ncbi:hypothetical protein C623_0228890 [Bacillus thuringiensis serovar aizawai str. Hu4-2]|nr:hypothetical protein C623_0228890 [Bacillus thuringiensis serovar aizawai str. Hu4-2]
MLKILIFLEELEERIFTAFPLYDARNVIKNGDFNNG